jgi:hypothetical protein
LFPEPLTHCGIDRNRAAGEACRPKLIVKEDMMQRKWLVAALTAVSVAALASPAAAWGTRSNAQAYGAYGWGGPDLGFGVTVGGPYAANWGWGWNGSNNNGYNNNAYAAYPGGCTCGTAAYGWGYPNYGWNGSNGYAYQPGWDNGYSYGYQPGYGWGNYDRYGGRPQYSEQYGTRVYHRYGTRGRTIHTGAARTRTVGAARGTGNVGAGQGNFNAGANGNVGANGGTNGGAGNAGGANVGGANVGPNGRQQNQ